MFVLKLIPFNGNTNLWHKKSADLNHTPLRLTTSPQEITKKSALMRIFNISCVYARKVLSRW